MGTSFMKWGEEFDCEIQQDDERDQPWERGDGEGIVYEGQASAERGWVFFGTDYHYDYIATMAKAVKDGWSTEESRKAGKGRFGQAAAAVAENLQRYRDWCNDYWTYVGVIVTHVHSGKQASIWSVESDSTDYINELREELAFEACPLTDFAIQMYEAAHAA